MAGPTLSAEVFDSLRRYNTPTISNAIELFNVRPRNVGFLPHTIRCLLPDLGPIVGYAVTSQTRAQPPGPDEPKAERLGDYLRYVAAAAGAEDRRRRGPRRPAGPRRPVRRGRRRRSTRSSAASATSPAAARATSTRSRRLGFQPLRPESVRQPRLRPAGRFRQAGQDRRRDGQPGRPDPRRQARRLHRADRDRRPKLADACAEVERLERPLLDICRGDAFDLEEYIRLRVGERRRDRRVDDPRAIGPSDDAAGVGMDDGDRLEAAIPADGLVGADLVEPLALGVPVPLAELEDRRGVTPGLEQVEEVGVEVDADQSQETPGLPIAGPEDLVVPVGVFPAQAFDRSRSWPGR